MIAMPGGETILRWLVVCLLSGAAAWLAWAARASGPGFERGPLGRLRTALFAGPGVLRCRETMRLTPQHTLHLIECGPERFLVACHPAGATLLAPHLELPRPRQEVHFNAGTAG
jgi:hypothetical protein